MRVPPHVKFHNGSLVSLERILSSLLQLEARPTALVVMTPTDALTAYCHLARHGLRIPADISLVSLFDDLFMASMTPAPTRYTFNYASFARRLARLVISIATLQGRPKSISIVPDFVPGASIAAPPAGTIVGRGAPLLQTL